jgi:hypothetical protein
MSLPSGIVRTSGLGDNAYVAEATFANAEPGDGFIEEVQLPFGRWFAQDNLTTLSGLTVPQVALIGTNQLCLQWLSAANATTGGMSIEIVVPGSYNPTIDQLYLCAALRKFDPLGVDENADLAFQVSMAQHLPGTVDPAIAAATVPATTHLVDPSESTSAAMDAVVKRTLAAASATTMLFYEYQWDLGANKRTTAGDRDALSQALRIKPNDRLTLKFGPDDTVGSSDMTVECSGIFLRWIRHAGLANKQRRWAPDGGTLPPVGPTSVLTEHYIR